MDVILKTLLLEFRPSELLEKLPCMLDQNDHCWWITHMFSNLTDCPGLKIWMPKLLLSQPLLSDWVMLARNFCKIHYMNSTAVTYGTQKLLTFRSSLIEWVYCVFFVDIQTSTSCVFCLWSFWITVKNNLGILRGTSHFHFDTWRIACVTSWLWCLPHWRVQVFTSRSQ